MENAGVVRHSSAGGLRCNLLLHESGVYPQRPARRRKPSGRCGKTLPEMERRELNRLNVQLGVGVLLVVAGLTLIFLGMFIPPRGEIHNSVLIAYGEISTFAGALIGVDYHYRYRDFERTRESRKADKEADTDGGV